MIQKSEINSVFMNLSPFSSSSFSFFRQPISSLLFSSSKTLDNLYFIYKENSKKIEFQIVLILIVHLTV